MKTERLYYNDPYLLEFVATVLENRRVGNKFGVVLDKTAFYPTSGGQPNDLGFINEIPLLDCIENEDTGEVLHIVDHKIAEGEVHCKIDSVRRSDHMQQHSGQHVLSQAFVERFGWPTVSFHLGPATCTIDLPTDSITQEQTEEAEELANRIVQENRAVSVRYILHEEIATAGLRKPTERSGEIRVIDIAHFDRSACGGTHVRMTGEIGPILIIGHERAKKQTRVQFVCGTRAIRHARSANRVLATITQMVSAPPFESAEAVRTLRDEHQQMHKQIEDLESKVLDYEAAQFPLKNGVAVGCFKNRGIEKLKLLAIKICSKPGAVALLADEGDQLRIVFARSGDSTVDVSRLLKTTLEKFGGRGGGRPNLAQGGGLIAETPEAVLNFASDHLLD